jgi:hypothetical protein
MTIVRDINSYLLKLPITNTSNVRGVINLNCAQGWTVTVQFQQTSTPSDNEISLAGQTMMAFAPAESYEKVLDLLRHEKPCKVIILDLKTPPELVIETGTELVGEGGA